MTPTPTMSAPQVVSLHSLGGPLKTCCAAAHGGRVIIYEPVAGSNSARPKTEWVAHAGSSISAMHVSNLATPQLITGSADGTVIV